MYLVLLYVCVCVFHFLEIIYFLMCTFFLLKFPLKFGTATTSISTSLKAPPLPTSAAYADDGSSTPRPINRVPFAVKYLSPSSPCTVEDKESNPANVCVASECVMRPIAWSLPRCLLR